MRGPPEGEILDVASIRHAPDCPCKWSRWFVGVPDQKLRDTITAENGEMVGEVKGRRWLPRLLFVWRDTGQSPPAGSQMGIRLRQGNIGSRFPEATTHCWQPPSG